MPKLSMTVISQTISSSYVSSSQVSIHVEISTNVLSKKNKTCYFSHFSNHVYGFFQIPSSCTGLYGDFYFVDIYETLYDHLQKDNRVHSFAQSDYN
jgi:hypothetical protein